jgi:hypothetical protein
MILSLLILWAVLGPAVAWYYGVGYGYKQGLERGCRL